MSEQPRQPAQPLPVGRTGVRETDDVAAAAGRFVKAVGKRAAGGDPDALPFLVELGDLVEQQLAAAVLELNTRYGWSWAEIGRRLGITRQAAQQRFGR